MYISNINVKRVRDTYTIVIVHESYERINYAGAANIHVIVSASFLCAYVRSARREFVPFPNTAFFERSLHFPSGSRDSRVKRRAEKLWGGGAGQRRC